MSPEGKRAYAVNVTHTHTGNRPLSRENALDASLRLDIDISALIAQALHMGDTARHPLYSSMERAAIEEFRQRGIKDAHFSEVVRLGGVSKATAYRLFPGGIDSLIQYLHIRTLLTIVRCIRERTAPLQGEVRFEHAVQAGLCGVVQGLRTAPFTATVLRRSRDLMNGYLLSSEPGGILNVLADYTARCAVGFGSKEPDVRQSSRALVGAVFGELVATFPAADDERAWPDPDSAEMERILHAPIQAFFERVKLKNDESRSDLAVPRAALLDEFRLAVPRVVRSGR